MDIEFHYYMTYLIAVRAGFNPADAAVIAQSAQEIDDNHIPVSVSEGTPFAYESVISQTMDILHPKHNDLIYPVFHFIPGDPTLPSARRGDGQSSRWITTPNSALASEMLNTALRSKDLYRIGASSHAYADTWAHQNFLGRDDSLNEMPVETIWERIETDIALMRIGHALAGHLPDIPSLIWIDRRLVQSEIDNTSRFMGAAENLFRKFASYNNATISEEMLVSTVSSLLEDLRADIGPSTSSAVAADPLRIARYKARARSAPYGGTPIPDYIEAQWADAAFNEARSSLGSQIAIWVDENAGPAGDVLALGTRLKCTWKDPVKCQQTSWFKFQQAVRSHLEECITILKTNGFAL